MAQIKKVKLKKLLDQKDREIEKLNKILSKSREEAREAKERLLKASQRCKKAKKHFYSLCDKLDERDRQAREILARIPEDKRGGLPAIIDAMEANRASRERKKSSVESEFSEDS